MDTAVSEKPGPLQPRNEAEHAQLLRLTHPRLTSYHIIYAALGIIPAQLDHGPGPLPRFWIDQPDRPQGPEQQGSGPPSGHLLDRQAGLEEEVLFKGVQRYRLGGHQLFVESLILLSIQGAVQIGGRALAVAGAGEDAALIQAVGLDQRRDGVVEKEVVRTQLGGQILGQGLGGQRAAGHHQGPFGG